MQKNEKSFKPKAHILRLLGEELISSPIMAIYELIKNSYDADATDVYIDFIDIDKLENSRIVVEDNGIGITSEILENVWLEPGTDYRKPINEKGERKLEKTKLYERIPMGEKGVGRFAAHKLGNKIRLTTHPCKVIDGKKIPLEYELEIFIDWEIFSQNKYLEDVFINWEKKLDSQYFQLENGGTRIEISNLKEVWKRGMARNLKREVASMLSPKNKHNFNIKLDFGNNWLDNLPTATEILDVAPYKYTALLDEEYNLIIDYKFELANNPEIGKREIIGEKKSMLGELRPRFRKTLEKNELLATDLIEERLDNLINSKNPFKGIYFEIYSYELDSESMRDYAVDTRAIRRLLKEQHGIRVFKDDLRVYNYGEPNNDWLELDFKRVQNKAWFSNNQSMGFIYLDSETSTSLVEQTNREGFIDNDSFKIFYECIQLILQDFQEERQTDRLKWRTYNHKQTSKQFDLFEEVLSSIDISDEDSKKLKNAYKKLEKDVNEVKDNLLLPAGVGLTVSAAYHEIEKVIPILREVINSIPFNKKLANEQLNELKDHTDGILSVLRRSKNTQVDSNAAIKRAVNNYRSKLKNRKIEVNIEAPNKLLPIKCDKRLFITMLMNIIDNSIYWLDTIYSKDKGIYITTFQSDDKTDIVIVDNGPGFKNTKSELVAPFVSRKPKGMGIGLYLVDMIMIKYGKLDIITSEETFLKFKIPSLYRGAAIKLTFNH